MGVGWLAATEKAGLLGDIAKVRLSRNGGEREPVACCCHASWLIITHIIWTRARSDIAPGRSPPAKSVRNLRPLAAMRAERLPVRLAAWNLSFPSYA
jgi:hypothetical protein